MTYCERFPPLKPHDPLTAWTTLGYTANWKIYLPPFPLLMATKFRKLLTSRRSFSTQALKLSQTSCLFFPFLSFSLVFLDGLTKIFVCFFLFLWKAVVTNNGLINMIFRVLWGHVLKTAINSSGRLKWEHVESCFSTTENIVYSPPHCLSLPNLTGWFNMGHFYQQSQMSLWSRDPPKSRDKLKPLYLH